MASEPTSTPQTSDRVSLLDEWRAEVGDDEIARIVERTRHDASSGQLPSFTDQGSLLAHWRKISPTAE